MNNIKRKIINDLSKVFIETFNITIPVKLEKLESIIKELDGVIEEDVNVEFDGEMTLHDGGNFVIKIPEKSSNRAKFTISHEIGHLVLHSNKFGAKKTKMVFCRNSYDNEEEFEANEFAASLLMPEDIYYNVLKENTNSLGVVDVNNMANYFEVSRSAVINRGIFLGVVE